MANGYDDFLKKKHDFFKEFKDLNGDERWNVEQWAANESQVFLSRNRKLITEEFNEVFAILSNKNHPIQFWLYCYYCCTMLETYHLNHDGKNSLEAERFTKLKEQIKQHCAIRQPTYPAKQKDSSAFKKMLGAKIAGGLEEIVKTPKHISKSRWLVGFLNGNRNYINWYRGGLTKTLQLLKNAQWIAKLNELLGRDVDLDGVIKLLQIPTELFKKFSIGFFAVRLIMNMGIILKHAWGATDRERDLSIGERTATEVWELFPLFLNDVAWIIINALTNYPEYFPKLHITTKMANGLTAGFLAFDVAVIFLRYGLAWVDYSRKYAQLEADKTYYTFAEPNDDQLRMLKEQFNELNINWKTTSSTLLFNAAAAFLIASGFTATMIISSGVLVPLAFSLGVLGTSMYLSEDYYKTYKEKSLRNAPDYKEARSELFSALAVRAIAPTFMMAVFAVSWQAALLITVGYMAYQLYQSHQASPSPEKKWPSDAEDGVLDYDPELVFRV